MKFLVAIAALLAVTVDAQSDYRPFENPGAAKCVVKGAFNKDNSYYSLKLGSCTDKNVANLRHSGNGKELSTSDKYCFDTIKADSKADVELVLRKCGKLAAGNKWTKVGRNQWQNGNKLCIEYNTKSKKFQQRKCATLPSSDKKSYQQWVFKAPPPPPAPTSIKCADWGKKWVCAKGWVLDTKPGLTCVGATGSTCANVCCKPAMTCQSAGFSQKRCPADYKFVNRECGNQGQKPCMWEVCCDYAPPKNVVVKCNQWNRCNRGFELKPRAKDIFCTSQGKPVEGPGYAPMCSNDICCDAKPVGPTPINCGAWNEKFGQCNGGFQLKPSPNSRQCYNPSGAPAGSTVCNNDFCCEQSPVAPLPPVDTTITCKQWTGKCRAADGLALVMKPADKKCTGADCASICCERDTCENWGQRVVIEATPSAGEKTGEVVCNEAPYAGLVDKSDPMFETPCTENGRDIVCKPSLCCHSVQPL